MDPRRIVGKLWELDPKVAEGRGRRVDCGGGEGEGLGVGDREGGMQKSSVLMVLIVEPEENGWGPRRGRQGGSEEEVEEREGEGHPGALDRDEPETGLHQRNRG